MFVKQKKARTNGERLHAFALLMKNSLLTLCGLIVLLTCSCKTEKKPHYLIGVSQCSDDLWRQTMNGEMLREVSLHQNVSIQLKSVKDDTQKQIKEIESFIAQGVDLLIVSPNESTAITPVIQKAFKKGIPVILVDRKIDTEDYTAYIGADNYLIGKEVGIYIASILKGKGNVVEIRGLKGSTSDEERHRGFVEIMSQYPDIQILKQISGNFLKSESEKKMNAVLSSGIQIDLIFAMNDPMAVGAHNACLKFSGKHPLIVGIDALPGPGGGIENIQKGIQDASFIYPTGGDKSIELALKILQKEPFERENSLQTAAVNRENARVIQLQTDKIKEHQAKLEKMNGLLIDSFLQHATQQNIFYATMLILILITLLLGMVIKGYRAKSNANILLESQNREISLKTEILKEQKDELISLSQQLEEATQAKLVFFTNISHEFRTPLTLILGPVDTLLKYDNLQHEQRNLLNLIKRSSNSLLRLISQIIEFRTYENGKMETYFSHADLLDFLQELNLPFVDYAKRKNIDFMFEAHQTDFHLWFDKEKIEKIYFNLLSNAFKYTNPHRAIRVSLQKEVIDGSDFAHLIVFNEGKLIPKEKIDKLFNRFFKVNRYDEGSGIGLAYTATLVAIHKGQISVQSIEGEGTTFSVLLPFMQKQPPVGEEESGYLTGYIQNQLEISVQHETTEDLSVYEAEEGPKKPIVLIIEDNVDVRHFMRFILKNEYTILEAENGEVGIEKAQKHLPEIIISDVLMPEKDGFEVCHVLKNNFSTSHIPIILLTACSQDEQKAIGFESGADAYIPKPFDAELLKIRVRKLIENRQKIKEAYIKTLINGAQEDVPAPVYDAFLDKFQQHIESCIADSELGIDDVAKTMCLSRSQLYRKIKSLTDYSPVELIKIIRLNHAAQLLKSSQLTVSEISYQSGFTSPSYFSKCFKEFYKENPTDYAKMG